MRGRGNLPEGKYVTTPSVAEELKSQYSKNIYHNNEIKIHEPSEEYREKVRAKAEDISSPTSEEDNSLVAIGLERDGTVVSDDRGVQNLCLWLGVDFQGYMEDEISERMEWEIACLDCGSNVSGSVCSVCGSSNIERKPL